MSFIRLNVDYIYLAAAIGAFLLGLIISRIYKALIAPRLVREGKAGRGFAILAHGFETPVVSMLVTLGVYAALRLLPQGLGFVYTASFAAFIGKGLRLCFIFCVMWGLWRSSDIAGILLHKVGGKLDMQMSRTVSHFFGYIFKGIVVAVAAVIVISELGYDINGLVAGLGLGGLTFALAAKETAANFFGGLVIILDKPFEIGDWISALGIEGIVEDVSFRSTKIRTFQDALTVVPNAKLSNEAITNYARMNTRKASATLELPADITTAALQALLAQLREALAESEDLASGSEVRFDGYKNGIINVNITYFTKATQYAQYVANKEKVNLAIMDILARADIRIARPVSSVIIENEAK